MPSPYSYDLRIRVVTAVEQGMEVTQASQIVGLPRDPITGWLTRKEATGDIQAKGGSQRGHSQKITDPAAVQGLRGSRMRGRPWRSWWRHGAESTA